MSAPFSRRDLLRGGRDVAAVLSLSTLAGTETPLVVAPVEAAQNTAARERRCVPIDRRQACSSTHAVRSRSSAAR